MTDPINDKLTSLSTSLKDTEPRNEVKGRRDLQGSSTGCVLMAWQAY